MIEGKELYKSHRPKDLDGVIGQDVAVTQLKTYLKNGNLPHFILLTGPSGCGKTTIMKILRRELCCSQQQDFQEINGAAQNGIDTVRRIQSTMWQSPMNGDCKIYAINEVQKMTSEAQNAFLETLEETPSHVYFIFTTTASNKLLAAVKTRGTEIVLNSLSDKHIEALLMLVLSKEKKLNFPKSVVDKIIEYSDGSARKALVFLDQVINLSDENIMLQAIEKSASEEVGFAIAQALNNYKTTWEQMVDLLGKLEHEEPETIRYIVLGYAVKVLKNKNRQVNNRAMMIINSFRFNFYESKVAGLYAACYEVIVLGAGK